MGFGFGLAERAAKTFSQVVARLPELQGLSADLVDPKAKKKKSQPDEPTAKVVVVVSSQ